MLLIVFVGIGAICLIVPSISWLVQLWADAENFTKQLYKEALATKRGRGPHDSSRELGYPAPQTTDSSTQCPLRAILASPSLPEMQRDAELRNSLDEARVKILGE